MANMEQLRARYAWACVGDQDEKYKNLAKGAPALIVNNGLMQALAFYLYREHLDLAYHIAVWIEQVLGESTSAKLQALNPSEVKVTDGAIPRRLLEKLFEAEPGQYRRATEEALALLRWIRQFAAARIGNDQ